MSEYTQADLEALVGQEVVVDCGDSVLSPFGGAEVAGVLSYVGDGKFRVDGDSKFTADEVLYVEAL